MEYLLFADVYALSDSAGANSYCGRILSLDDANRICARMDHPGTGLEAHLARWVNNDLVIYYVWEDGCFEHLEDVIASREDAKHKETTAYERTNESNTHG